jgi:hypothetical protein
MLGMLQIVGAYALTLVTSLDMAAAELRAESRPSALELAALELPTLWAGHQVTFGRREIPFKGEVETRMDSFVIARLVRDGDLVELHQTACDVRFSKVAGVVVHMDAQALPPTRTVFSLAEDDANPNEVVPGEASLVGRSVVAWASEDLDDDGHPGVTVQVQAPVCSGELYVSNRSRTKATATLGASRLEGRAKVHVKQRILGAEGACLSAVAKDTDEHQSGPFAYVPVPEGTTCEMLVLQGWPVFAE